MIPSVLVSSDDGRCTFERHPVPPECFVGRDWELRDLLRRAVATDALVNLVGPRKIGRTSFLHYVRHVVDQHRSAQVELDVLAGRNVIAPYVDLASPRAGRNLRRVIVDAIVVDMRAAGRKAPEDADLEDPGVLEELGDLMTHSVPPTRYMLLIDGAEHLLADPATLREDEWAGGAVATLGTLNEYVSDLSLVFSFGVGGQVRSLDSDARERREQEFLETVSALVALAVERMELGRIDDDALRTYAQRATVVAPDGVESNLTPAEIDWVIDLAGGHPFVFQYVGRLSAHLKARKRDLRTTRAQLESRLPVQLSVFIGEAFRRIADHPDATKAAAALSNGGAVTVDAHTAALLVGEGLAIVEGAEGASVRCSMPSRALREAVRHRLRRHTNGKTAAADGPAPGAESRAVIPPFTVAVVTGGAMKTTSITPAELALLSELKDGALVPRERLRRALADRDEELPSDKHLTQRLSSLRKKLDEDLGVAKAIVNVYGEGYRLTHPEQFIVAGHAPHQARPAPAAAG